MSAWFEGRLCAIDCETTGVDPETGRIVQVAVFRVGGGARMVGDVMLVDPGVEIPEAASAVHGITTERAAAEGLSPQHALGVVSAAVNLAATAHLPLIVYNARFDLTLIDREVRRHGLPPLPWDQVRVVDPFVIDKWLHRFRRGSRRLEAVCQHYGVPLVDAHDAGADALAAARLAWRLATSANFEARHPEVIAGRSEWKRVRGDLDALHAAQVGWARDQAESLAAYFRENGKADEAASVRPEWPLIPVGAPALARPSTLSASELLTPEWTL